MVAVDLKAHADELMTGKRAPGADVAGDRSEDESL
jgi:hypothetical protein